MVFLGMSSNISIGDSSFSTLAYYSSISLVGYYSRMDLIDVFLLQDWKLLFVGVWALYQVFGVVTSFQHQKVIKFIMIKVQITSAVCNVSLNLINIGLQFGPNDLDQPQINQFMQLSVEQIIAKVALQRQKQKQQDLLKHIHHKSSHVNHSRINQSKNTLNPLKRQIPSETNIIQKYKQLQGVYKKLKVQISTELKMGKKYSQVMENLTKVIQKNSRLQTQLDGLRMKQSVIVENQRSWNEDNKKRIKSKKWMATEYVQKSFGKDINQMKSVDSVEQYDECCKCRVEKEIQNDNEQLRGKRASKQKVNPNITKPSSVKDNATDHSPHAITCDLTAQIQQYQFLLKQKSFSIQKLQSIAQKQQQLIKQYESQSMSIEAKSGGIQSKLKQVGQPSGRKVEGTIVKVKREHKGGDMANRAMTDRRDMLPTSYCQFLSPTYMLPSQEMTRKKPQANNPPCRTMEIKSPGYQASSNRLNTYIQSLPSYEQSSGTNPHYYQSSFHSPTSSINETSEFVCGELE